MKPPIVITRDPLQIVKVDAIGYGAKDTGEMGGGAEAAVIMAAGPEILVELKVKLARSTHQVGDVVLTEPFKLRDRGVRWVIHIISIIKHTPQGAYCPQPERLREGVCTALVAASAAGARSIAFSALSTGEGRVPPLDAARYMAEGVAAFRRNHNATDLAVTFSLPSFRDYEAFSSVL